MASVDPLLRLLTRLKVSQILKGKSKIWWHFYLKRGARSAYFPVVFYGHIVTLTRIYP